MNFGYTFGSIDLTGIVYFDKAHLDLNSPGVTCIKGWNKNARVKKAVRNGSGKSLLFSVIPNVVLDSSPVIMKSGRSAGVKSSLLDRAGSSAKVAIDHPDAKYVIDKHRGKSTSVKYTITKNGKDMGFPTATKAAAFIRETIFPFSETEFYSYTYLHGNRVFPLQMGTSTERMQFFSDMFHLEQFDYVREGLTARKKELRDDEVRLKELQRQLAELDKDLGDVDPKKLRKEVDELTRSIDSNNERVDQIGRKLKAAIVYRTHAKAWEKVDQDTPIKKQLQKVEQKLGRLDEQAKAWRRYERWQEDVVRWKEDYLKAKEKAGDLSLKECRTKISDAGEYQRKYERQLDKLEKPVAPREVPKVKIDPEKYGCKTLEELLTTAEEETARFIALGDLQKQINELAGSTKKCLVCGSKTGQIVDRCDEYEKQVGRWGMAAQQAKKAIRYAEYRVAQKEYDKAVAQYNADKQELKKKLEALPDTKALQRQLRALEWIADNPKPKWEKDVPEQVDQAARDKLVKLETTLRTLLPVEQTLRKTKKVDPSDIQELEEQLGVYRKRVEKQLERRGQIEPTLENHSRLVKKIGRLKDDVNGIRDALEELPLLESLIDIYSKNGRKLDVMRQFAASLEQRMNENAPLLFPEPMSFEFVVQPNNFGINVTRGRGKNAKTSDIKMLSGAESRQFNLCLVMSLLPMIPLKRRTNMIVLDEMDANLSEPARELYVNEFIPALQKIVPHVVVITPLEDIYPGARSYMVVKEGNKSEVKYMGVEH